MTTHGQMRVKLLAAIKAGSLADTDEVLYELVKESEDQHNRILALESAFKLLNRQLNPPAQCPCGWKPREDLIGGQTLEEHQTWCSVYQEGVTVRTDPMGTKHFRH